MQKIWSGSAMDVSDIASKFIGWLQDSRQFLSLGHLLFGAQIWLDHSGQLVEI
jgi:hypothetical protein